MEQEELYENIYKLDTNCIYEKEFMEFTDKSYIVNETITEIITKEKTNIINNYSIEELLQLYKEIIPINKIKRDIVTYDFIHGSIDVKCENVNEIFDLLISQLDQYQWSAGGFDIEDREWIECSKTTRFIINENQKAIYNTFESLEDYKELKWFLENMITRISKTITKPSEMKIYYKIIEDEKNEINWIIIIIESH